MVLETYSPPLRILVTGARGLIGTHLMFELINSGYDVIGVDKSEGDLCLKDSAIKLIEQYKPDIVLHLAAIVGREFGEVNPGITIATNTLATLYLAKACKKTNIKFIYISTSEAFGDNGTKFVLESDLDALPHNIYGLSKRWGEEAARLYAGEDLQIIRLSMPYGPGFPAGFGRAALVTFIWNLINDNPITVFRGAKRSWCWIVDLICGIRTVVQNGGSGLWTVGRDDNEASMLEVAYICCDILEKSPKLINLVDSPSNETLVKRLPNSRLINLGWKPTLDIVDGCKITAEIVKLYDVNGMPTPIVYEKIKELYAKRI